MTYGRDWVTAPQLAEEIGRTRQVVTKWCRAGLFGPDAVQTEGGRWMIYKGPFFVLPKQRKGRPKGSKNKPKPKT